jgi:hypothetical protein
MAHLIQETHPDARNARLRGAMNLLAQEAPDALDQTATLARQALAEGDFATAAAAAGVVVLTEHLQAGMYKHAMSMLDVLTEVGPQAASHGSEALLAWAGAAVAHDYGVLPSWPAANVTMLMESAQLASADFGLALACALGEVCERNGDDAEFALIQAQVAALEVQADASPFWRGYWAIVCAWHECAFAKVDEGSRRFDVAHELAAAHGLRGLAVQVAMQRARLIEWRRNPDAALALAFQAVAHGDPARTPLWFADLADVQCCAALRALDFQAAVSHARRALGHLQLSNVWPGYHVTYQVNEAYALIGAGAAAEAVVRFRALSEVALPRYLGARLRCLVNLSELIAMEQVDPQIPVPKEALANVIAALRTLEWAGVLHLLPQHIGRIFCHALNLGVEPDWVCAAIRTRRLGAPRGAPENWPWRVRIRALGSFEVSTANEPLLDRPGDARKAASKPLELLRYLASRGHDMLPVDGVARELWPGDGRDGRRKALEVTVARLRKLLECNSAIIMHDNRIGINRECVWVDVQALSEQLFECERAAVGSDAANRALELALNLYSGPCLADSSHLWATEAGERWRRRLSGAILRSLPAAGGVSRGREFALRAVSADPEIGSLLQPAQ